MRIVISTNLTNGIGLEADYRLLRAYLESLDHEVSGHQFNQPPPDQGQECELGIFIETISDHLFPLAKRWFYIANPEWLRPEYIRAIQRCEKVFAKTREAERVLREKFSNVHYVGFLTADKGNPNIARERKCLHLGGNSGMRGTNAVIEAWRSYRYWDENVLPPLTVISNSKETTPFEDTLGITFIKRVTDEQVTELQNSHLFHVMPSATEGFGHALHESQSVGAIILTTQAPPMNELKAPFEVPYERTKKVNMGTLYEVSPVAIREAVPKMTAQPNHVIARMQTEARLRFEKGNAEFRELFAPHLRLPDKRYIDDHQGNPGLYAALQGPTYDVSCSSLVERPPLGAPSNGGAKGVRFPPETPFRIAMLGNFHPPHSTENDLLWTLRDMGHEVTTFQENKDTTEAIFEGSKKCDLLIYIATHGWRTPGRMTVDELIERLRDAHITTASFHLDRYWGLNQNDHREDKIGTHPFWHAQHVFTADGGNQDRFAERKVNHHWLPPACVRRECHRVEPKGDLACDIGFVGATGYHPEYPFRTELIESLRNIYGDRFRVFAGYRGEALNTLYASLGVVVGDSCFGGSDFYWSDRVPETIGRGGFLIHPASRGLDIPGLVTFEAGNISDLQDRINYYLDPTHASEREHLRCAAQKWVTENETYHNRMGTLLKVCGLG